LALRLLLRICCQGFAGVSAAGCNSLHCTAHPGLLPVKQLLLQT
jgi:hypothetical protein